MAAWLHGCMVAGLHGCTQVAGDLSDLFLGHSTWDTYTSALRIYKMYEFEGLADEVGQGLWASWASAWMCVRAPCPTAAVPV